MKLVALSKMYFKSGWNIFDLIIVVASILDLVLEYVGQSIVGLNLELSVFRTFRLVSIAIESFY